MSHVFLDELSGITIGLISRKFVKQTYVQATQILSIFITSVKASQNQFAESLLDLATAVINLPETERKTF
jgi:hypothetical protein